VKEKDLTDWTHDLIDFWFSLTPEQWFAESAELDAECRDRFLKLWEAERDRSPEAFLGSADAALAALILFDQLPRNMFRGHADSFATDPLARAIADGAIAKGFDQAVPKERRAFFYLPFEHSEDIADQKRSLALFTALGDAEMARYARLHHDVIERFGRFPHRNEMLGRKPRQDEIEAGDVTPF